MAADVYAHPMHVGRGGWTWYTGSAGWMYQAAIDGLLGLRRSADTFSLDPCIPAMWPEFSMEWRHGRTRYSLSVKNPDRQYRGVRTATLDGADVDARAIPLHDDGRAHHVIVTLGVASDARSTSGAGQRERSL